MNKAAIIIIQILVLTAISCAKEEIPHENLPENIKTAEVSLDLSVARATGGTGLGLSIALESISMIGGSINVQSEEGNGTTFCIDIPLYQWFNKNVTLVNYFVKFSCYN